MHFLDRELRRAENIVFDEDIAIGYVTNLVLGGLAPPYCNTSILFESGEQLPRLKEYIFQLEKNHLIHIITSEFSYDEFIHSRASLYSHARIRYPTYFTPGRAALWPQFPKLETTSTTIALEKEVLNDIGNTARTLSKFRLTAEEISEIESAIISRAGRAITLDIFNVDLVDSMRRRKIGRLISYYYTKRYLNICEGGLMIRMPQFDFFTSMVEEERCFDYSLFSTLFGNLGFYQGVSTAGKFNVDLLTEVCLAAEYPRLQILLHAINDGLIALGKEKYEGSYRHALTDLQNLIIAEPFGVMDRGEWVQSKYLTLSAAAEFLSSKEVSFRANYSPIMEAIATSRRIIIAVATRIEHEAVAKLFGKLLPTVRGIRRLPCWYAGRLNDSDVYIVKTDAGSVGVLGAEAVLIDAIDAIGPKHVISVGICFGMKPEKQALGNVLVSRQVVNYQIARVGSTKINRSDKPYSGSELLSRADNSSLDIMKGEVQLGLFVCGEYLVDDEKLIRSLRKEFPEALGGDMESYGVRSACEKRNVQWLVVKGICDWGYNKNVSSKDLDQATAAENAARFVHYMLKMYPL